MHRLSRDVEHRFDEFKKQDARYQRRRYLISLWACVLLLLTLVFAVVQR